MPTIADEIKKLEYVDAFVESGKLSVDSEEDFYTVYHKSFLLNNPKRSTTNPLASRRTT